MLKIFIKRQLKNENFKREWCIPDCEDVKILRTRAGLTQKELGERIGTKQEAISRLERNSESATLKFIGKVAYALGYRAKIVWEKL